MNIEETSSIYFFPLLDLQWPALLPVYPCSPVSAERCGTQQFTAVSVSIHTLRCPISDCDETKRGSSILECTHHHQHHNVVFLSTLLSAPSAQYGVVGKANWHYWELVMPGGGIKSHLPLISLPNADKNVLHVHRSKLEKMVVPWRRSKAEERCDSG